MHYTAIDLNTTESNLGDIIVFELKKMMPFGPLYIEIIMIVSLISGLQVHDTCNSEELTQKHLYNIISTTREAASVLNLKRPAGPPLLGKFPYKFSTNTSASSSKMQNQGNYRTHTVRNLHFLSKNSTLISRENC